MTRRRSLTLVALFVSCTLIVVGCTDDGDWSAPSTGAADDAGTVGDDDEYAATITRTDGGIPHIVGDSITDVTFGQGWASAEDRACDLADQVVMINGERARWFGPGEDDENVDSDLAWRAIGIRAIAGEDWDTADDEVRQVMTAYTRGWNAHLAEVGSEGIDDWCAGAEWVRPLEPVEVYAYARTIALNASSTAVSGYLASAQPPAAEPTPPPPAAPEPPTASNGWAIGSERSQSGGGMLVANPHFPWEGQLRFWEVQLTVPGEFDIYGAQLSGLPGVAIGFTDSFAWTHTVSAGNRFTAYQLELAEGDPTSYRYGDETRAMTSTDVTIDVLGEDGTVESQPHTLWRSHYGPILDFPGVGWTAEKTVTFRDANIDNDEFIEQYIDLVTAQDLDDLIRLNREVTGVPLFNTIAVSNDGRAWYGDTSATPKLSDEAIVAYEASLESDFLVSAAADSGAVLLDGSDPLFEWEEVDGARDPGLVPYSEMPVTERADYVFNANDSFWMPHATEMLDGDYSPLHGPQRTVRTPRTRENAEVLSDTSDDGLAGSDGRFDLDELSDAALANEGFTARALRSEVVERCTGADPVAVEAIPDDSEDAPDGAEVLPAATVDLTAACEVLDGWDGIYDLDRQGPALWREFISRFDTSSPDDPELWQNPFDPAEPLDTPNGLRDAPAEGPDPVLVNLARAVQLLDKADVDESVTLGEIQWAVRNGTSVPIHGGTSVDGTTNIVGWGSGWSTMDPSLLALDRTRLAPDSTLATVTDGTDEPTTGYRINNGTSFLMAVEFTDDGPSARTFLTYSNTADRSAPNYLDATERFSEKNWRDVAFTASQIDAAAVSSLEVRG